MQPNPGSVACNVECSDQNFTGQGISSLNNSSKSTPTVAGSGNSSGISLAQLMSEHEQKSQGAGQVGAGQGLGVSSLAALPVSPSAPSSLSSTPQTGLSLGTLASWSISSAPLGSAPHALPPSLLAASLGNLSLSNPRVTGPGSTLAPPPPPGFGSLTSALQSSHPMEIGTGGRSVTTDTKGSPSLADLIQEHSNSSPTLYSSLPGPHSSGISGTLQNTAVPAHALSLSQLASQHHNKHTHTAPRPQDTVAPAHTHSLSKPSTTGSPGLGGVLSLSQLASQHQVNHPLALLQPLNTGPPAQTLQQLHTEPAGVSEALSLSQLVSEHQTKTVSNISEYSLTSLLSSGRLERGGELLGRMKEGVVQDKPHPKRPRQKVRPPGLGQNIDLSALMAQSPEVSPRYDVTLSSPSAAAMGSGFDVFARPSIFATTLSLRAPSREKRRMMKAKVGGQRSQNSFRAFLYSSQTQPVKVQEQPTLLLPITPFRFDTPSPDDIVRANQKKAFTR